MAVKRPLIGQMRQIVKFERNEPTQLGAGRKDNYVEWFTTRGALEWETGRRTNDLGEAVIRSNWVLYVRKQAELQNFVSKSIRIVCNNRFFTVDSYTLINQKEFFYRFVLNEKE